MLKHKSEHAASLAGHALLDFSIQQCRENLDWRLCLYFESGFTRAGLKSFYAL